MRLSDTSEQYRDLVSSNLISANSFYTLILQRLARRVIARFVFKIALFLEVIDSGFFSSFCPPCQKETAGGGCDDIAFAVADELIARQGGRQRQARISSSALSVHHLFGLWVLK